MYLNERLYEAMAHRAGQTDVEMICMGLGYTAVTTSDGGVGLSYTYFRNKARCTMAGEYDDLEGRPARDLLSLIKSDNPLDRSKALALINALNHSQLIHLPADKKNDLLFDILKVGPGSRVAMVGYFKPLMGVLDSLGTTVEVIDEFKGMGEKKIFYQRLSDWADAALITSTAILNNTMEEILGHLGTGVRAAILGPSTPLVAEAFYDWPAVKALAGTVALNTDSVLKAVRHGLGTPHLHRYSRKATITTQVN
jgi:uncharacterized protein (DUF4213/DUF364 family)